MSGTTKENQMNEAHAGAGSGRHDSQHQLQELIDELPEGYVEYDLKGNIVCWNRAIVELGGREGDELVKLSFREYTDHENAERTRQAYKEVYRTGIARRGFITKIVHKDGRVITIEGFISLKKINGQVVGFRGIWRDITERRRTEHELARHRSRLEAIFGGVKDGIVALDAQGHVTNANQAVAGICGVGAAALVGSPFPEESAPCGKTCHAIIRAALADRSEIKECQIACRRDDRPQQVVVLNSSPLIEVNSQSMGAVLVIKDITELLGLEKELKGRYQFQNIVGKSPKMQQIYDLLETLASLGTTVLITGESGTGKELVAKALHYAGERGDRPFVKVNCSALSESLLESELFGHVKGAFTGAIKDRMGRFEMADRGTILLDEIGDISPLIQLKLLRVLQEKEFERVGESAPRKVDVRVIASTNKDLKEKVKNGEFREDLYYRLKVMPVVMPALRERMEDLPLLVNHFCHAFRASFKKKIDGVSSEVLGRFMNYRWPGNVRELEHALEHAFVLCNESFIRLGHLPVEIRQSAETGPSDSSVNAGKKRTDAQTVLNALEKTGWRRTQAAHLLGVNRRTIYRKIKQYGLEE
jgi:PAS domain S-box-containing protein